MTASLTGGEILGAFVGALSEVQAHATSNVWPGTVESYDAASNIAQVRVDGSSNAAPIVSLIGGLVAGQRVSVLFDPPHGALVLGNGTTGGTSGGGDPGTGGGLTAEQIQDMLGTGFLVGGPNMSWAYDDTGNTLTVNTTALNQEQVEDLLGGSFVVQGSNIRIVYNDVGNTLTFSVTQLDTVIDANGHTLNNLPDPVLAQQPVTLAYFNAHASPSDLAFPFFMGT